MLPVAQSAVVHLINKAGALEKKIWQELNERPTDPTGACVYIWIPGKRTGDAKGGYALYGRLK